MNEPKKRGRPSKAEMAARNAQVEGADAQVPVINGDTSREPEDVMNKAQAYANRVWDGQSPSLERGSRLYRVKMALEAQGMSMDGVVL